MIESSRKYRTLILGVVSILFWAGVRPPEYHIDDRYPAAVIYRGLIDVVGILQEHI